VNVAAEALSVAVNMTSEARKARLVERKNAFLVVGFMIKIMWRMLD